jgi:hypothetical protein
VSKQADERLEDWDFLMSVGEDPIRAYQRVGWPTAQAAEVALRRGNRDVPHAIREAIRQNQKKAA